MIISYWVWHIFAPEIIISMFYFLKIEVFYCTISKLFFIIQSYQIFLPRNVNTVFSTECKLIFAWLVIQSKKNTWKHSYNTWWLILSQLYSFIKKNVLKFMFSSVQSLSRVSLRPHESEHARPPCPSPTPGVYSNSCPSSLWCHPTISSSVIPFSSCLQPLPASGSFPMSQLFASGGQSTDVSASASILPMNTQDWSPLRWTG